MGATILPPKSIETLNPPPTSTTSHIEVSFESFVSTKAEDVYRTIFSHCPIFGEREININDFPLKNMP